MTIYWTHATGAHSIVGAIRAAWIAGGRDAGVCGGPASDEMALGFASTGIRANLMTHNNCEYAWTAAHGAHFVMGGIRSMWASTFSMSAPNFNYCGGPVTNELSAADGVGRYSRFALNSCAIYWTPKTGVHQVGGLIGYTWTHLGAERSWLGYPTSNEYSVTGGRRSNFQHGYITYSYATRKVTLTRA